MQADLRVRIFTVSWLSYFSFYLCRKNLSVLLPLLQQNGFAQSDLANLVFVYSVGYSAGQFLMGPLSDRFGPRLVVSVGMFTSAIATALIGFLPGVGPALVLQAINGLAQSCGWSGLVKMLAHWYEPRSRGIVMGWFGTSYVLGGFIATVFATWAATGPFLAFLGFRRGFWLPAAGLAIFAVIFAAFARNRPSEFSPTPIPQPPKPTGPAFSFFSYPPLLVIAAMYFCIKLTRYALLFWLPLYMTNRLQYSAADAGYVSSVFELAGFLGAVLARYVSDRLMNSRRFPTGAIMLFALAAACLAFPLLSAQGPVMNALGIGLIGMLVFGPDTLMSGAAVQDIAPIHVTARVSGMVNGLGSIGQAISPYAVSGVVALAGWDSLFHLFVVLSLAAGAILATQWRLSSVLAPEAAAA